MYEPGLSIASELRANARQAGHMSDTLNTQRGVRKDQAWNIMFLHVSLGRDRIVPLTLIVAQDQRLNLSEPYDVHANMRTLWPVVTLVCSRSPS
jgi:hypothetical protein